MEWEFLFWDDGIFRFFREVGILFFVDDMFCGFDMFKLVIVVFVLDEEEGV